MALLTAATDTLLYTCPSSTVATKNVRFCDTGAAATTIRLSKTTGGTLTQADALLWEFPLPASGIVEVTQIYMVAGDKLYVRSAGSATAANHIGPEDAA